MWPLIRIELFKTFRKPRTYIAFVAIAAIILLVQLALYVDGETYLDFMMLSINTTFMVEGKQMNGYLVFLIILQTLLVHVLCSDRPSLARTRIYPNRPGDSAAHNQPLQLAVEPLL